MALIVEGSLTRLSRFSLLISVTSNRFFRYLEVRLRLAGSPTVWLCVNDVIPIQSLLLPARDREKEEFPVRLLPRLPISVPTRTAVPSHVGEFVVVLCTATQDPRAFPISFDSTRQWVFVCFFFYFPFIFLYKNVTIVFVLRARLSSVFLSIRTRLDFS